MTAFRQYWVSCIATIWFATTAIIFWRVPISVWMNAADQTPRAVVGIVAGHSSFRITGAVVAIASFRLAELRKLLGETGDERRRRRSHGSEIALAFIGFALTTLTWFMTARVTPWRATAWLVTVFAFPLSLATVLAVRRFGVSKFKQFARAVAGATLLGALGGEVVGQASDYSYVAVYSVLQPATLHAVHLVLGYVVSDRYLDLAAFRVGTSRFNVAIDPPCAGHEGVGFVGATTALYLFFFRRSLRLPRSLALFPLALVCTWLLNVVRIVALIAVGSQFSRQAAMSGFHSHLGWVLLVGVVGGVVLLGRSALFRVEATSQESPSAPYLAPLLVWLCAMLVTGLFLRSFDSLYGIRVVATVLVLYRYRATYARLDWRLSWWPLLGGVVAYALWIWVRHDGPRVGMPPGLRECSIWARTGWIALRVIGATLVVPIIEELAFRAYIIAQVQRFSASRLSIYVLSVAVSALSFGLLHSQWFAGSLAGAIFAVVYLRRGRVTDAIVAHAVTNACVAVHVLAFGAWELWI